MLGVEELWTMEWEESWEDDVRVAAGDRGNGPFETPNLRPPEPWDAKVPFWLG